MSNELEVNANYNGRTDRFLLDIGNTLSRGEEAEIVYSVVITPNGHYGPFQNIVNVEALDFQGMVFEYKSPPVDFEIIPQEIFISEGFSPNGDGVHDALQISLSCGLSAKLMIYNRWGERVYSSDNYQNDWTGSSNHGSLMGKTLPDGTYFYRCELSNGSSITNFLTIKR